MTPTLELGELQMAVMRVLWERGEGTAADVHGALAQERRLAPTTVSTLLTRLEKRGVVDHRTEGRQYVYRALVTEEEVRRSMVGELAERLFAGDVTALVCHLLTERDVAPDDWLRVRELMDQMERDARGERASGPANAPRIPAEDSDDDH